MGDLVKVLVKFLVLVTKNPHTTSTEALEMNIDR